MEVKILDPNGKEVQAGEVGEICVRGDSITKGYWKLWEEEARELRDKKGWLHTGDMATVDGEGYVYIVGRNKDMIISGGFNIYPKEIEDVILRDPRVQEVAVIGIPDDLWGESVKAVVVPKPSSSIKPEEIQELCAYELGGFKKPRSVDFADSLPKNAMGKILKAELLNWYLRDIKAP